MVVGERPRQRDTSAAQHRENEPRHRRTPDRGDHHSEARRRQRDRTDQPALVERPQQQHHARQLQDGIGDAVLFASGMQQLRPHGIRTCVLAGTSP